MANTNDSDHAANLKMPELARPLCAADLESTTRLRLPKFQSQFCDEGSLTHCCFRIYALQVRLHLRGVHEVPLSLAQTDIIWVVTLPFLLQTVVTVST